MNMQNSIQEVCDQIGIEAVERYMPRGMKICTCNMHGRFLVHYTQQAPECPSCKEVYSGEGNGTTASEVELFIDLTQPSPQCMPGVAGCTGEDKLVY